MLASAPFLMATAQAQPRLVNERGRLQGLPRRFVGHLVCRKPAQLRVNEREQFLRSLRIIGLRAFEDAGHVAHKPSLQRERRGVASVLSVSRPGMQRSPSPIPRSPSKGSNGSIRFSPAITRELSLAASATASVFSRVACSCATGLAMSLNMISEGQSSAAAVTQTRLVLLWETSIFALIKIARSHRERRKPISQSPLRTRNSHRRIDRRVSSSTSVRRR